MVTEPCSSDISEGDDMIDETNLEAEATEIVEAKPWEVTSVADPVWFDADHTVIKCTVSFASGDTVEGYAACSYDPEEHGRELFAAIVSGKYGPIDDYVPRSVVTVLPAVTLWERLSEVEAERERDEHPTFSFVNDAAR